MQVCRRTHRLTPVAFDLDLQGPEGETYYAQFAACCQLAKTMKVVTLVVRSAEVPEPVHVRYCYTNIPSPPFLYNAAGLPAATFSSRPE